MKTNDTTYELLKLMAHPIRLAILRRLLEGECCVDHLTQLVGQSQPNVSQHLKRLLKSNLIRVEHNGRRHCYSLNSNIVEQILNVLDGANSEVKKSTSRKK